ncbi:MAG TPA: CHAD domain-containing protein [Chitinophaga sp.]
MQQRTMSKLLHKRYRKINAAFDDMHRHFTPDAIHDFRVQVKKLKALLHLFAAARKGRPVRKVPARLQKFYLLTGRIRTHQLQAQAVAKDQQPASVQAYMALLQEHTLYLTTLAQQQSTARHLFRKGEKRLAARLPRKLSRKKMRAFLQASLQPLEAAGAHAAFPEETLHGIRKGLKDLQYTLPVLHKYAPGHTFQGAPLSEKALQELTGLIGDYLDTGIQVQLIHSDRQAQAPDSQTAVSMHALENKWVARRRALRRKITEALQPPLS